MTLTTTLPTSKRRPGAYHEFKFVASGSLVALERRLAIVAEKSSVGTATADTPVRIIDEVDGDAKFGVGSLGALMVRKALAQGRLGGIGTPQIWGCPCAENGAGTAATYTLTFTGTATASGTLVFEVCGRLIQVGVTLGDTHLIVAAAVESKLDEEAIPLPVTAGVAAGVVTLTFRTKGVNGNDVSRSTITNVAGITLVHAAAVAGAGATVIAGALAALYDQAYDVVALANHATGDATALLADSALAWGFGQINYRWNFMGERASLGTAQTLQASFNDYRTAIMSCEGSPSLPGEIAVAAAVAEFAREEPNANLDGERLAITPPTASLAYTDAEVESALAAGVTPLTPDGTAYVKIERLVTTQITVSSAPFEALRDIAYPRTSAYMALQVHYGWLTGFKQETLFDDPDGGDDIKKRVRDMVIGIHRAAEELRYIRNVDDFIEGIIVEEASSPAGRLVVADPFKVAGPLHQGAFVHTMYL